jgi:hypothetical protein
MWQAGELVTVAPLCRTLQVPLRLFIAEMHFYIAESLKPEVMYVMLSQELRAEIRLN